MASELKGEQLLGNLYAIRAGLSIAFQEKENIDRALSKAKREADEIKSTAKQSVRDASERQKSLTRSRDQMNRQRMQTEEKLASARQSVSVTEEKLRDKSLSLKKQRSVIARQTALAALSIVFAAAAIPFVVWVWNYMDILGVVAGFGAVCLLVFGITECKFVSASKRDLKALLNEKDSIVAELNDQNKVVAELVAELDGLEKQITQKTDQLSGAVAVRGYGSLAERTTAAVANYDDAVRRADEITAQAKKEAAAGIATVRKYMECLNSAYGSIINPRDWANIDILIFAVESHRTDTLKETLAFADGEIRTQRVENAVAQASSEIQTAIKSSVDRLSGEINRGFAILSAQMAASTNKITASIDRVAQNVAISAQITANELGAVRRGLSLQSDRLAELTSVQRMNNALVKEASVSSAKLSADVGQLCSDSGYIASRLGMSK